MVKYLGGHRSLSIEIGRGDVAGLTGNLPQVPLRPAGAVKHLWINCRTGGQRSGAICAPRPVPLLGPTGNAGGRRARNRTSPRCEQQLARCVLNANAHIKANEKPRWLFGIGARNTSRTFTRMPHDSPELRKEGNPLWITFKFPWRSQQETPVADVHGFARVGHRRRPLPPARKLEVPH